MTENTKIEWADHTFNPWVGCQKVGPGCDNCYAEGWAKRSGLVTWGPGEDRRLTSAANWRQPLKWNAQAKASGTRARVFCASLADVFDNAVRPEWRSALWDLIQQTPHLDWLLLTKRPGNIPDMLPASWGPEGWPNVWLGCTVVNQAEADRDIGKLFAVPARVRFLSMEPLLGPVDITQWLHDSHCPIRTEGVCICDEPFEARIDWVIVGGESGPKARPMHPDWARSLRDQCQAAGVPFLFKQWGEWADCTDAPHRFNTEDYIFTSSGEVLGAGHYKHGGSVTPGWESKGGSWMSKAGKARAGRLLDGREWNQLPGVDHAA